MQINIKNLTEDLKSIAEKHGLIFSSIDYEPYYYVKDNNEFEYVTNVNDGEYLVIFKTPSTTRRFTEIFKKDFKGEKNESLQKSRKKV